ncbi:nuclear export factor GLE1 [Acidovorax carolinensis]|uniref:Nuclear export factor GLE1 n=2 Tax=Acidovorax carolinensis TaxID=553814 RepID=A0ACD6B1Y0_9BURK|nr:YcnI family protein [Acidovorax carolinensis]ART53077.1 nuclear export factor GLE1 [Acidovorax carolinensis]ART54091.1 nuclear export factor GLE1 [Acidovorax carolinensis]ART60289.1 nuclear export factor GLE1 [Acidovorax carolinensis]
MKTIKTIAVCALLTSATGLFNTANAHVTLEYQVANAGSGYKATFRVGHGCGESPTREIAVTLPSGVQGAKPMPKAGWTIAIEREALAAPRTDHGKRITDEVRRIRWTANTPADALPNAPYDEFVLQARLPAQAGVLYWPVAQVCEQGRVDWAELPGASRKPDDLKFPAPVLELMPAAGGHAH